MSVLFVVAHCNLFNFHLDVASQITGSLAALHGNPRTPLVLRNVERAVVFFFSFFFNTSFQRLGIHWDRHPLTVSRGQRSRCWTSLEKL